VDLICVNAKLAAGYGVKNVFGRAKALIHNAHHSINKLQPIALTVAL